MPRAIELRAGFRLDRYELTAPLSRGGMASVWLARRFPPEPGRPEERFAIKTILSELSSDPRFRTMFLDEAAIASKIHHPNVVAVHDLGEANGVLYLVMELVEGQTLARLRGASGGLPVGSAVKVAIDTCAGLHAAHELRAPNGELLSVVHRDVSPQNVLVSAKGSVKLIDFGIAKAKHRLSAETSAGGVKGKLRYMPPEQASGREVDRRADVWATGALLYDLLAGRAPYEMENDALTLFKLVSMEAPPPLPPSVPSAIADVVFRALAPDPAERYPTADAMRLALEQAAEACGVEATTAAVAAYAAAHLGERGSLAPEPTHVATELAMQEAPTDTAAPSVMPVRQAPNDAVRAGTSPPPRRRAGLVTAIAMGFFVVVATAFGIGLVVVKREARAVVAAPSPASPSPAESAAAHEVASASAVAPKVETPTPTTPTPAEPPKPRAVRSATPTSGRSGTRKPTPSPSGSFALPDTRFF